MKLRTKLAGVAVVALVVGQLGVAGAGREGEILEPSGPGTPGISKVGDISHVKNIGGWSGSDIEFASSEVVKLSNGATGTPVCVADATQPDGCAKDADGATVFQKEVRDFAVAGALGQNARVIDITDPANAAIAGIVPCTASQNDIQISGNLLFVAADPSAGSCQRPGQSAITFTSSAILDFSNPRAPKYLSRLQHPRASHNHTVHPTKPFVYVSDSDVAPTAGLGSVPVWSISDPANPVLVTEFKHLAHSPHDITFNADGSRAYVAAVSASYILNTENPASPVLISTIANEGISISHQSDPTPDGDYLLISDELGGGAAGLSPGGPVHVYDIRNEAAPVKVGIIEDDCLVVSHTCAEDPTAPVVDAPVATAHVFRINPDGYTMAIAWYKDGVHVVDYSSIRGAAAAGSGAAGFGARTIGRMKMPNANTWSAKMWQEKHPGYVFANDIRRGLDIFYVPELGGNFVAAGTVHAGNPAVYAAGVGVTKTEFETNCEYSPVSNGVDGWVAKIPASLGDGNHSITGTATAPGGLQDVDLYFYDKDCVLLGFSEETGSSGEIATAPEGTMYVLTTTFAAAPAKIRLTSGPAQPA